MLKKYLTLPYRLLVGEIAQDRSFHQGMWFQSDYGIKCLI
jgi:hypothetical protein